MAYLYCAYFLEKLTVYITQNYLDLPQIIDRQTKRRINETIVQYPS